MVNVTFLLGLCCAALLTAAYLWRRRRQRRRLLRGSAATAFCHFNSCALCKADALLSIFHRQLLIYAKKKLFYCFVYCLYLLYSSLFAALYMLTLCRSAVLLRVHLFFSQSATKIFLFTRTRNQFATSIFHAHTCKNTPVWGRGAATDLILSCKCR